MTDRPDPDELLARLQHDEAQARRGKLKIFFGASAGVGKTYAMLAAAQSLKQQGTDVMIGVVETHGRAETQALVAGLELLPLRAVPYRDRTLMELDLDGALARKPQLVLVDELAHSNVPGSRHPKRWQDVEELSNAGIDVWTTMNVQHLESLNDVVTGIIGIKVWETVPDRVFDDADEVVIVDLPPDELLQRLKEGKVYMPQQAERAVRNFFRKGNLLALRELALRRTADRVDDEMLSYRSRLSAAPVWPTREALLACIGPGDQGEKLVRAAARLAAQLAAPWHAVYVETPALQRLPQSRRQAILRALKLAQDLGADTATLASADAATSLAKYARDHNLSRLLLGRRASALRLWPRRSVSERLAVLASDLDIVQIALPKAADRATRSVATAGDEARPMRWQPYAMSATLCALVTLATAPLLHIFELSNIVMLFLLAVVAVAVRYGRGPAVLAAFLSVGAFDFFYVPPRFTMAVTDLQYVVTFVVMLAVALVVGQLTAGLKYQARVATIREDRVRALYEMSRDLSAALLPEQVVEIGTRFLQAEFEARAAFMLTDAEDRLTLPPPGVDASLDPRVDLGVAQWAYEHGEAAGYGTDTLPGSPMLYVPLKAPMRVRGVLALEPKNPGRLIVPEQRRLLDTFASLLAIAIERIHYVEVAQGTTLQMESERLRNSLLAAISHDLRTPLASLVGLADSLSFTPPTLAAGHADIARSIQEAAMRMNSLVNNLLDMAKLESGKVNLNLQWLPLEEVVGSALRSMKPIITGHYDVKTRLPADLPLVRMDAVLIERVLCNLIENAVKYSHVGTAITIGASASSDHMDVWVDDEGPGLPKGRELAIFDKFERGRKESSTPGVGLGLAICRAIVEAHHGTIRGENRPGGGARFVFTIPRDEPPVVTGLDLAERDAA